MNWKTLAWALVATVFATSPGLACKGKKVLFEDSFAEEDPGWTVSDRAKVQGGKMVLTAPAGRISTVLYKADVYDQADICVDLKVADPKEASIGGIMFAVEDTNNFYTFWISPMAQTAGVIRMSKGKWLDPVSARKFDGVNNQAGASNTIRLTLNGPRATAYVNDKKFIDFRINPLRRRRRRQKPAGLGILEPEGHRPSLDRRVRNRADSQAVRVEAGAISIFCLTAMLRRRQQ